MRRMISFRDFDWVLLAFVLLICTLGVVEVYSTTFGSKFAGVHVKQIYWILGGRPKETGLEGHEPYYPRIARAYLIGEAAADFERRLKARGVATRLSGTLERAVAAASADAAAERRQGAVVLLSPACASFDQFANFEERGERFRALVAGSPAAARRAE